MNELKLTGKLYNIKKVETKTGASFTTASIMLSRKDKQTDQWENGFIPVKAFKEVASQMLNLPEKPKVLITGKIGVDSYKDKQTGKNKNSVYIMAFGIELDTSTFGADPKAVEDVKSYDLGKAWSDDIPF